MNCDSTFIIKAERNKPKSGSSDMKQVKEDTNMHVGVFSFRDALLHGVATQSTSETTMAGIQPDQHIACSKTTKVVHFTAPTSSAVSIIHKEPSFTPKEPRNDSIQVTLSETTKEESDTTKKIQSKHHILLLKEENDQIMHSTKKHVSHSSCFPKVTIDQTQAVDGGKKLGPISKESNGFVNFKEPTNPSSCNSFTEVEIGKDTKDANHMEKVETETSKKHSLVVASEKVNPKINSKENAFDDGTPKPSITHDLGSNNSSNTHSLPLKASSTYVASKSRVSFGNLFPIGFRKVSKLLFALLFLLALNHTPASAWTLKTAAKNENSGYSLKGNSPENDKHRRIVDSSESQENVEVEEKIIDESKQSSASDDFRELSSISNGSFMLQNGMKFDDSDRDWCLTAESFESKAKLHMRPCASTENNYLLQWFFFDDIGRMRLSMKPEFCLRWSGKGPKSEKSWKSAKSGKKQPFFYTCDDGSAKYKFKFVDGNIQAVGYGRPDTAWYLGIRPGEKKYEALRLFKAENSRDLNESLGMWNA